MRVVGNEWKLTSVHNGLPVIIVMVPMCSQECEVKMHSVLESELFKVVPSGQRAIALDRLEGVSDLMKEG